MKSNAIRGLALLAACGMMLAPPAVGQKVETVSWLSNLGEGYRRALADRKPLLVRVGAKWCPSCRKLAADLETAKVQTELARWTPVYIDLDDQPDDANELGVVGVPALRIRTPGGEHVAGRDGYLKPDELVEWLKSNYDAATAAADDVLLATGEPGATAVVRLVKQFRQRNPALREAAVRRLLPYPTAARPAVLKAFREGSLTARLAALEALEQWKAPVADLDPWRPETFTPERLARLDRWSQREAVAGQTPPKQLSAEQLAAARRQIERMLGADEAEADAIRQRLAGLGAALLPEVYARLKDAAADQDRRRLLILRYRLAACDSLVLRWPGGLERLGDADPRQRRQAADELAKLAGDGEKPLLLELFADTDPLVREISLRGLQHIGGNEANAALVKLLADPEPNVRAAVLKQLEEAPDPAMVPAVVKYLKDEKDPDLIVHGICFLRASKGSEALRCLMSLLKHESWQVRAEAAVGIGKRNGDSNSFRRYPSSVAAGSGDDAATKLQVDAYVALLDLLEDSDAFVVAKAVEGLSNADMALAVEPLVKVVGKHPDLAAGVLAMLAGGNNMRAKAIPHLRKFCKHELPRVRAAAIAALCSAVSDDVADELAAALNDKEGEVRIAGASALLKLLDALRQQADNKALNQTISTSAVVVGGQVEFHSVVVHSSVDLGQVVLSKVAELLGGTGKPPKPAAPPSPVMDSKPAEKTKPVKEVKPATGAKEAKPVKPAKADGKEKKPAAAKPEEDANPQDQWLTECYAGRRRPKWTSQMAAPLEKMLAAGGPKERIAAALALVPLGKAAALPVLIDAVRASPDLLETAEPVLPWLLWTQRLKTFHEFRSLAVNKESRARLIGAFGEVPDRRVAEPLWELLADAKVTTDEARALQAGLMAAYVGNRYYMASNVLPADRRDLVKAAKPRVSAGGDWQRLVALTLLATVAPDEAAESAAALAGDPKLAASLRADAFQIQLITQPAKQSRKTALAAIGGTDAARKKLALKYLVHGPNELRMLDHGMIFLYGAMDTTYYSSSQNGTPIVPKPPEGVAVEDVRPLAGDSDPEVAACAGYLLALLGESDGMEPLMRYWRGHGERSSQWRKLVYRAIAVVDDPKYIPALREIYSKLEEYEMSEFYWTIRIMSGPEILKFRKQIREEVGASRLGS